MSALRFAQPRRLPDSNFKVARYELFAYMIVCLCKCGCIDTILLSNYLTKTIVNNVIHLTSC